MNKYKVRLAKNPTAIPNKQGEKMSDKLAVLDQSFGILTAPVEETHAIVEPTKEESVNDRKRR